MAKLIYIYAMLATCVVGGAIIGHVVAVSFLDWKLQSTLGQREYVVQDPEKIAGDIVLKGTIGAIEPTGEYIEFITLDPYTARNSMSLYIRVRGADVIALGTEEAGTGTQPNELSDIASGVRATIKMERTEGILTAYRVSIR
jgi:hypothetical protein